MKAGVARGFKLVFFVSALAIAVLIPRMSAQTPADSAPTFRVEFLNTAQKPARWSLTLHQDGTGHFQSKPDKSGSGEQGIATPSVDRDIRLSAEYTKHVFEIARSHKWFDEACESHLKVAFQGWKTLAYAGPEGQGTCTFNYSKNRDIEQLGDSLVAVAETILEGARLEVLLDHDRLGLDAEMEFLTEAASDGRAQQICAIRGILERLADDDSVLDRVRKRARMLLEQSTT